MKRKSFDFLLSNFFSKELPLQFYDDKCKNKNKIYIYTYVMCTLNLFQMYLV